MPNVGGKRFPYTPAGRAAANRYARQTGRPMNGGGYGGGGTLKPLPGVGGYGGKGMPSTVTGQPMGNDAIDGLINGGQKRGWLGEHTGGRPDRPEFGTAPIPDFQTDSRRVFNTETGQYEWVSAWPTPPVPQPQPSRKPQNPFMGGDITYSSPRRQRPMMGGRPSRPGGGFLGPRRGRGRIV